MNNEKDIRKFLFNKFLQEETKNRNLKSATVEILNLCNFKCVHCYNQDLCGNVMKLETFKDLINKLSDMGCKEITITGGETTMHPNFAEIYSYCYDAGLQIKLFTNGYFIDKYIDLLKQKPPYMIEISLYGCSDEIYKKVCKIDDGFTKVTKNIKLLKENGINLKLKSVMMEQNFCDYDKMIAFCEKMGLPFKFDLDILNSKNFSNDQSGIRLSDKSYEDIMVKVKRDKLNNWQRHLNEDKYKNELEYLFKCHAGRSSLFVSCFGGVRICNFAEFTEKNLKDYSLKEIWDSFDSFMKIVEDKETECYKCKYKQFCSNCPVVTYMTHHTDGLCKLPVPQNCREAKYVYKNLMKDE